MKITLFWGGESQCFVYIKGNIILFLPFCLIFPTNSSPSLPRVVYIFLSQYVQIPHGSYQLLHPGVFYLFSTSGAQLYPDIPFYHHPGASWVGAIISSWILLFVLSCFIHSLSSWERICKCSLFWDFPHPKISLSTLHYT